MGECHFVADRCHVHRDKDGTLERAALCIHAAQELERRAAGWEADALLRAQNCAALESGLALAQRSIVDLGDGIAKLIGYDGPRDGDVLTEAVRIRLDQAEAAMRALESLTPGGSEYVGDVECCVAFIRESRQQQHEAVVKFKRERDLAEAAAAAMREASPDAGREKG